LRFSKKPHGLRANVRARQAKSWQLKTAIRPIISNPVHSKDAGTVLVFQKVPN